MEKKLIKGIDKARTETCHHCKQRKAVYLHPFLIGDYLCPRCFNNYIGGIKNEPLKQLKKVIHKPVVLSTDETVNYISHLPIPFSDRITLIDIYLKNLKPC